MAADRTTTDINETVGDPDTMDPPNDLIEGRKVERIVRTQIEQTVAHRMNSARQIASNRGEVLNGLAVGVVAEWKGETYKVSVTDGMADNANAIPVSAADTVFEIGSITKVFTATMLAAKVADGSIGLNDLAQDHVDLLEEGVTLPTFAGSGGPEPLRVQHLADYTSGFRDRSPTDPDGAGGPNQLTVENLYDYLNQQAAGPGLATAPGSAYAYINTCFGLLARILMHHEGVSSYRRLLKRLIADAALEMPKTGVITSNSPTVSGLAVGYDVAGNVEPDYAMNSWPALQGGGAIYSTCDDMLEWLAFNMGLTDSPCNNLLPITQFPRFRETELRSTGLGWNIRNLGDRAAPTLLDKDGSTKGFHSYIGFYPDEKIGVIVLSNTRSTSGLINDLGANIIDALNSRKP